MSAEGRDGARAEEEEKERGEEAERDGTRPEEAEERGEEEDEEQDEEEVAEVGVLIEALNRAIDAVNLLEDEHQQSVASFAGRRKVLQAQLAAMEAEAPPWQAHIVAAVEARQSVERSRTQLAG